MSALCPGVKGRRVEGVQVTSAFRTSGMSTASRDSEHARIIRLAAASHLAMVEAEIATDLARPTVVALAALPVADRAKALLTRTSTDGHTSVFSAEGAFSFDGVTHTRLVATADVLAAQAARNADLFPCSPIVQIETNAVRVAMAPLLNMRGCDLEGIPVEFGGVTPLCARGRTAANDDVDESALDHVEESARKQLLPMQRAQIFMMGRMAPEAVWVRASISEEWVKLLTDGKRKQPFVSERCIPANTLPMWTVLRQPTGSGKTMMTVFGALRQLTGPNWTTICHNPSAMLARSLVDPRTGMAGINVDACQVARCAFIMAPEATLPAWSLAIQECIRGWAQMDPHTVVRFFPPNSRNGSLAEIAKRGHGHAADEVSIVLRKLSAGGVNWLLGSPDVVVPVCIIDEMNASMAKRYTSPRSPVLMYWVPQATLDALRGVERGDPSNPLRLALGGGFVDARDLATDVAHSRYPAVQKALEHFTFFKLATPPEPLLRALRAEVVDKMPRELAVWHVPVHTTSLAGLLDPHRNVAQLSMRGIGSALAHGMPPAVRRLVEDAFGSALFNRSSDVLRGLDAAVGEMASVSDTRCFMGGQHMQKLRRESARLAEVFAGTATCAICLEDNVCLESCAMVRCCSGVFCTGCMQTLQQRCVERCPLCNAPFVGDDVADLRAPATDPLSFDGGRKAASSPSSPSSPCSSCGPPQPPTSASDEVLGQLIAHPSTAGDAIERIIVAHAQSHSGARVVLFANSSDPSERGTVRVVIDRIRHHLAGLRVTFVSDAARDRLAYATDILRFNSPRQYPAPALVVASSEATAGHVQGLDLPAASLTIFADHVNAKSVQQACGRFLRMQPDAEEVASARSTAHQVRARRSRSRSRSSSPSTSRSRSPPTRHSPDATVGGEQPYVVGKRLVVFHRAS